MHPQSRAGSLNNLSDGALYIWIYAASDSLCCRNGPRKASYGEILILLPKSGKLRS